MQYTTIEIENNEHLDRLLLSNPDMEKAVQLIINKVVKDARKTVMSAASGHMRSDPREAYKAVKTSVYKRILGGSVSILSRRKRSGGVSNYSQPSTRHGNVGGNRIARSERTQQIMSYCGADRAFILRFSQGTASRTSRYGNRGQISSSNWFASSSQQAIERAMDKYKEEFDNLIEQMAQ